MPDIKPTVRDVANQLQALGTAEAIAEFFRENGVMGLRRCPDACPVANHVKAQPLGSTWVSAGPIGIGVGLKDKDAQWAYAEEIPAVIDFINNFDMGVYPELEAADA